MLPLSKLASREDYTNFLLQRIVIDYNLPKLKNRKAWEMAMALNAFDKLLFIPNANFLGVGAGKEPTIASLARFAKRVTATDLYNTPGEWANEAPSDILTNPEKYFDNDPFVKEKVTFQHADGRNLPFLKEQFDGIFSCSSIEHFGTVADICQAASEMHRVLKPGGVAAISTEFRLNGLSAQIGNVRLFDSELLNVVFPKDIWIIKDRPEFTQADLIHALMNEEPTDLVEYLSNPEYAKEHQDHLNLQHGNFIWTSLHLTMIKR